MQFPETHKMPQQAVVAPLIPHPACYDYGLNADIVCKSDGVAVI